MKIEMTQENLDWITSMVDKTRSLGDDAKIGMDDLCEMFLKCSWAYYNPDLSGGIVGIQPDNLLSLMCEVLWWRRKDVTPLHN